MQANEAHSFPYLATLVSMLFLGGIMVAWQAIAQEGQSTLMGIRVFARAGGAFHVDERRATGVVAAVVAFPILPPFGPRARRERQGGGYPTCSTRRHRGASSRASSREGVPVAARSLPRRAQRIGSYTCIDYLVGCTPLGCDRRRRRIPYWASLHWAAIGRLVARLRPLDDEQLPDGRLLREELRRPELTTSMAGAREEVLAAPARQGVLGGFECAPKTHGPTTPLDHRQRHRLDSRRMGPSSRAGRTPI